MTNPSTKAVFDHHLAAFAQGIDELMRDYDNQSVLITPDAIYHGCDQIKPFLSNFLDTADEAFWKAFNLETVTIQAEIAYVTWTAAPFVTLAAETLHIRGGVILNQTFTAFGA